MNRAEIQPERATDLNPALGEVENERRVPSATTDFSRRRFGRRSKTRLRHVLKGRSFSCAVASPFNFVIPSGESAANAAEGPLSPQSPFFLPTKIFHHREHRAHREKSNLRALRGLRGDMPLILSSRALNFVIPSAAEGSAVRPHCATAGKPQIPPFGLKSSVGMTK